MVGMHMGMFDDAFVEVAPRRMVALATACTDRSLSFQRKRGRRGGCGRRGGLIRRMALASSQRGSVKVQAYPERVGTASCYCQSFSCVKVVARASLFQYQSVTVEKYCSWKRMVPFSPSQQPRPHPMMPISISTKEDSRITVPVVHKLGVHVESRPEGVTVTSVCGVAKDSGIRPGDCVLSLDNRVIHSRWDIRMVLVSSAWPMPIRCVLLRRSIESEWQLVDLTLQAQQIQQQRSTAVVDLPPLLLQQ